MLAALFHPDADHRAEKGFCNQTCVRMSGGDGSERTSVAADEMFSAALQKNCRSTHFLEQLKSGVNPLFFAFPDKFWQVRIRDSASDFPHGSPNGASWKTFGKNRDEMVQKGTVDFGKNAFRFLGNAISDMRAPNPWLGAGTTHQAVSFQAEQVDPDGVIGEMQFPGEIIDSPVFDLEQGQETPPGAFEEALSPNGRLHNGSLLAPTIITNNH